MNINSLLTAPDLKAIGTVWTKYPDRETHTTWTLPEMTDPKAEEKVLNQLRSESWTPAAVLAVKEQEIEVVLRHDLQHPKWFKKYITKLSKQIKAKGLFGFLEELGMVPVGGNPN